MTQPHPWVSQLRQDRVIAVLRLPRLEWGLPIAQALAAGGIRQIEITWNSDRPVDLIAQLRVALPHCTIGAGTILTVAEGAAAIAAGAAFLFSPHTEPELLRLAQRQAIPMVPGAFTPTEIVTAWQAGAAAVKVFPIHLLGGVAYLQALRGPLGSIPLIPTGGVTRATAPALLAAGAIAVGLSTDLLPAAAIAAQDWGQITGLSQALVASCQGV